MRTGSRRKVCAIDLPGDAGAAGLHRSAPRRARTCFGGSWCSAAALLRRRGLVRRAMALAFCSSPAMRSRWRTMSTQRLPHRLAAGERGQRPLQDVAVLRGRVVLHRAARPGRPRRRTRASPSAGSSSRCCTKRLAHHAVGAAERGVDVAVVALVALQHVAARARARSAGAVGIERVLDGGDRLRAPRSRRRRAARRLRPRSATRRSPARPGHRRTAPGRWPARRTSGGTDRGAAGSP